MNNLPENAEDNQVTIVEDEDGLLIFGAGDALIEALAEHGAKSRPVTAEKSLLASAGSLLSMGSSIAQSSGQWVKMNSESAKFVAEHGGIENLASGVVRDSRGRILKHVGFEDLGLESATFANPAAFMAVGMYMQQMAIQQQLEEIQDYLVAIDKKLDTLIRDQHDRVISELYGLQIRVDEAGEIAESVGELGDVAWSKIDDADKVLAEAQSYALRKINYLKKQISDTEFSDELSDLMESAIQDVPQWLLVCAHALKIGDQVTLLELGKVQHDTPETYLAYRQAKKRSRKRRVHLITEGISGWGELLATKANEARENKLFHPMTADAVIESAGNIAQDVQSFLRVLEERELEISVGERPSWLDAAHHFVNETSESISHTAGEASSYAVEQITKAPGAIAATVSSVFGSFWGKADEKGKEDE